MVLKAAIPRPSAPLLSMQGTTVDSSRGKPSPPTRKPVPTTSHQPPSPPSAIPVAPVRSGTVGSVLAKRPNPRGRFNLRYSADEDQKAQGFGKTKISGKGSPAEAIRVGPLGLVPPAKDEQKHPLSLVVKRAERSSNHTDRPPSSPSVDNCEMTPKQCRTLREALSKPKCFRSLNCEQLDRLVSSLSGLSRYDAGQIVVQQGQPWNQFCCILSGAVHVSQAGQGLLGSLQAGQWFGDLVSAAAMATVHTVQPTECMLISEAQLDAAAALMAEGQLELQCTSASCWPPNSEWARLESLKFAPSATGRTTFGQVLVVERDDGDARELMAVKCIEKQRVAAHEARVQIENEIQILRSIDHSFIIKLHAVVQDDRCLFAVTELLGGDGFFPFLVKKDKLCEADARFYISNVFCAIDHLHRHGIVFRDLKPEALDFAPNGYLKLVDFGFAKQIGDGLTFTVCGTPDYMAPEIVAGKGHCKHVDLFSVGVLLYEMVTGHTPYCAAKGDIYQLYERIMHTRLSFPMGILLSEEIMSFISALLFASPRMRLGCDGEGHAAVRKHAWYTSPTVTVRDGGRVDYIDTGAFQWDSLHKRSLIPPHAPDAQCSNSVCDVAYHSLYSTLLLGVQPCEEWHFA